MILQKSEYLNQVVDSLFNNLENTVFYADIISQLVEESDYQKSFDQCLCYKNIKIKSNYEYFFYLLNNIVDSKKESFEIMNGLYKRLNPLKIIDLDLYRGEVIEKFLHIDDEKFIDGLHLVKRKYNSMMLQQLDEVVIEDDNEKYSYGIFKNDMEIIQLEDNGRVWMSLLPNEIITMKHDSENMKGKILCAGLGLGYFPLLLASNVEVKKVTVIELDKRVIKIFNECIAPKFEWSNKIEIIQGDAKAFINKNSEKEYDYIYIDIWHDETDGIENYLYFKSREENHQKYKYWIEKSLLTFLRRCLISVIYEETNEISVQNEGNYTDRICNYLKKCYKNVEVKNREELKKLISLDELSLVINKNKYPA